MLDAFRSRLAHSHYARALATQRFDWACRGVLRTPPLRPRPAPIRIVSMVRTEHVRMYLVAIKSFYRHLPGGRVTVLDDGSLTGADQAMLRRHVEALEIVRLDGIRTGPCPRGGCWERLLFILDSSAEDYVVQLDCDVLTTAPVPEVTGAIEANAAFTLNTGAEFDVTGFEAASARVLGTDPAVLQNLCEQTLGTLPEDAGLIGRRYVRGSAGFAGFPRGGCTRGAAEAFSRAMAARIGQRWAHWGTEQVTSNHIVASLPGGHVLPWPAYACFYPDADAGASRLLHFIGSWRFDRGVYVAKAREAIRQLGEA